MNKLLLLSVFVTVACAGAPDEPSTKLDVTSSALSVTSVVPGFVHSAARSRFHVGSGTRSVSEFGLEKIVGSDGTMATNRVTGAFRAILNATSPVNDVPPLTSDEVLHNQAVIAYFKEAGIPADQIGRPHVLTSMTGAGPVDDETIAQHPKFVGYTTYIPRVVDGVSVPDSFAVAALNANGEAVSEWVYWPPLPKRVLDDAKALTTKLGTAASRTVFLSALPPENRGDPAEVTIRHCDFDDERSFVAFASYDVHVPKGPQRMRAATLHFGLDGAQVIHPNRRAGVKPVPGVTSKP